MSTWKKASKTNQKVHRERHQPESRKHLGLLEKKEDYKARARDHNEKERTLKILRKRALNRNPDEFYFHMINSHVVDGTHHELEKDDEHTSEQIRLMQTQDLRYISTKRTIESKKIDHLQSELHMLDAANKVRNKHIFFVDTLREAKKFNVVQHLETHPALLNRRINRPRLADLERLSLPLVDKASVHSAESKKKAMYKELKKRIEREKELSVIQRKLELKRHLHNKKEEIPKRIKPGTKTAPPVYEWKYERKR
ncbi:hypothetical protein PR048_024189 [Dryococelus australis]|uniref:U3 small nucleolar RNA-associated protein 11 n=1 Tax=Dryococelus australis TaxID=614101 RepID=A0ABQ9GWB9_9NEOP|nr:hypothetical protein PR048_024189 [Dryococelus australis]